MLELVFVEPVSESVAGALGVGLDAVEPFDADKPAQDGTVGQQFAELAVSQILDETRDVAPQGHVATAHEEVDLLHGHVRKIRLFLLDGEFDEVFLNARKGKDFIDPNKEVALFAVVFASGHFK